MSSVFFKFKSQKDPQRVTFDGTGISVFELKREIINISRLGDGTDFDLTIYNQDTNEEYDDDTTIIPRSTSIVARRLPASKPGQGRAARYVSGRMPVTAKNNYRKEQTSAPTAAQTKSGPSVANSTSAMQNARTEEERIKAMFEMGGAQWEQQQQNMSNATRVSLPGFKNKNVPVPDHPPPTGYVCYRCGQKGHWIQVCPTNDNPEFENKPRIKRITGIPRSFLKTVEEPTVAKQDGLTDDARQPSSIMVNADGDRVVAVPDMAAWQKYQEKAKASAATQDKAAHGSRELQERGLECPIDKRLFVDPMKTPCCGTTYCNECIENALINSDLVCPNCSTDGVLLDNLAPDEVILAKIKEYEEEKKAEKKEKLVEKAPSPKPSIEPSDPNVDPSGGSGPAAKEKPSPTPSAKRKRSVDDSEKNDHKPAGPAEPKPERSVSPKGEASKADQPKLLPPSSSDQDFINQMNALAGIQDPSAANGPFNFNPMNMPPMLGMPNQMMMNGMMMGGMMDGSQWSNNMGMMSVMNGMPQFNNNMGGFGAGQNWQQGMNNGWNHNLGVHGRNQQFQKGQFQSSSYNQNQNQAGEAYQRQPINPHRQSGRQKKARPTDYREL